jgi:hypothetical protein
MQSHHATNGTTIGGVRCEGQTHPA